MAQDKHLIIGLGEILWDMLPEGKKLGGAPANFAYHCKQMGAKAYVISCVGDDDLGSEILGIADDLNLNTGHIACDKEHPTGTVSVKLNADGQPEYTIHEGVAWDHIPCSDEAVDLASGAAAICFGSLAQRNPVSRATIQKILQAAPDDCLKIFDINLRQNYYSKEIIEDSMRMANILKLNDQELEVLTGMFNLKGSESVRTREIIFRFNLNLIALTKGSEGSMLFTEKVSSHYTSEAVKPVDSVGAGDSFTAAICMGLLKEVPLRTTHQTASDLAAFICTQQGATPRVPEHLLKQITKNYKVPYEKL